MRLLNKKYLLTNTSTDAYNNYMLVATNQLGGIMSTNDLNVLLSTSYLFKGIALDPHTVSTKYFHSGQIIHDAIDGIHFVGLILSGTVDVYSVALDGTDIQLSSLSKGDCFGICNLFVPNDVDTVMRCRTAVTLLSIPKAVLTKCLVQDTDFALRYASFCNEKIQFLLKRIEFLTMQSCRVKVIEYLLANRDAANKVRCENSKEMLAKQLGISRAALFRELSFLKQQTIITQDKNHILIEDIDALEACLLN